MDFEALDLREAVSLYLSLRPDEEVDLEVAASMAIDWSRAMEAVGASIDPEFTYRVSLIAAKPGSKNWLAKIERSKANRVASDIKKGWEEVPLILKWTIALAVVVPTSGYQTYKDWFAEEKFSEEQVEQLDKSIERALQSETMKGHKRKMFREAQRDRAIAAIGGGVPDGPEWRPATTVPANQFALSDGLFEVDADTRERTTPLELDVIVKAPDLENAHHTWVFRQPGLPGTIRAIMRDDRFLDALEKSEVRERFRTGIPMRVRLEIKERLVGGEWIVPRGGRSVVEVISPDVG